MLAALLLPVLARSKEKARAIECLSNLHQWNLALSIYLHDNAEVIPRRGQGVQVLTQIDRPEDWFNALPPLVSMPGYYNMATNGTAPKPRGDSVFVCPTAQATTNTNFLAYAMNIYLSPWVRPQPHRLPEIPHPASLAFLADGPGDYSSTVPSARPYSVSARHARRANIALLDGHAQSFVGDYLGCGATAQEHGDIHWQTESDGVNQPLVP